MDHGAAYASPFYSTVFSEKKVLILVSVKYGTFDVIDVILPYLRGL
jgi:hypothetical protein